MDMIKKLRKGKKGFTLVELIVVLVILAILAAIAIPSFMGYINRARDQRGAVEARSVLLAARTIESETKAAGTAYANSDGYVAFNGTDDAAKIETLADVATGTVALTLDSDFEITALEYTTNGITYEMNADGTSMVRKTTTG